MRRIAVVGGGAAGFFAALAAKEAAPESEVVIIERSAQLLSKVRISGGGRCNVTHFCFDPKELVQNYPRGQRELLGPFHRFQPADTVAWFEERGVELKAEADGRMFPISDSSQTIIDCLVQEAQRLGVKIWTQAKVESIRCLDQGPFQLTLRGHPSQDFDRLILATGSSRPAWDFAQALGHSIQEPVPSLFTFNVPNFCLNQLAGVSVPSARVKIQGSSLEQQGPLLVTHWGFSGPAALKLSAWGARHLAKMSYQCELSIDWVTESLGELETQVQQERQHTPSKQVGSLRLGVPKKLWKALCEKAGLSAELPLARLSKRMQEDLLRVIKDDRYQVKGKTTNKEEFVTCGGVNLREVNFKTMESKHCPGLYFCGEVLDIDGVTGGFNFQNAWTGGWIAGHAAVE
jgi:predicted Rossmann fold flavoprotein